MSSDVIVIAANWDEVIGPVVVSVQPDVLKDPGNIALQIYMASIPVFGGMDNTERIEFTLPFLSLSPDHILRVAFDSWPDEEVRGGFRPFFIAFIFENKEIENDLDNAIKDRIWWEIDRFKRERGKYNTQDLFSFLNDALREKQSASQPVNDILLSTNYTLREAREELERAQKLWEKERNSSALLLALRTSSILEKIDTHLAAQAYALAGEIFVTQRNYSSAMEAFMNAFQFFSRSEKVDDSANAMYNAGIAAFRLKDFNKAKEYFLLSSNNVTDCEKRARAYVYLAISMHKLRDFSNVDVYFDLALNLVKESNPKFAGEIASSYAIKIAERAEFGDPNLQLTTLNRAAGVSARASEFFRSSGRYLDAAIAMKSSATLYMEANNTESVKALQSAGWLFYQGEAYGNACRIFIDTAKLGLRKGCPIEKVLDQAEETIKYLEKNPDRYLLQVQIYRERARYEEEINDNTLEAQKNYKEALEVIKTFVARRILVANLHLGYASLLFRIENYSLASYHFLTSAKLLEEDSPEINQQNIQKCLRNSLRSFKLASLAQHNAGNVLFYDFSDNKRSSRCYGQAIDFCIQYLQIGKGSVEDWITKILKSIKSKIKDFYLVETRDFLSDKVSFLEKVISDLKIV